jgi:CRP/FNR family transcriptional regulator, cyclic AMP receptor protein
MQTPVKSRPSKLAKAAKAVFAPAIFLAKTGAGRTIAHMKKGQKVFGQGEAADAVFYIQKGKIRLSVISKRGKEAIKASRQFC